MVHIGRAGLILHSREITDGDGGQSSQPGLRSGILGNEGVYIEGIILRRPVVGPVVDVEAELVHQRGREDVGVDGREILAGQPETVPVVEQNAACRQRFT